MQDSAGSLLYKVIFQFPTNKSDPSESNKESLIWTRYVVAPAEVNRLGCQQELVRRQRKATARYSGYILSTVGAIRVIRNARGHGFYLIHAPEEGRHHLEVGYKRGPEGDLKPIDKDELKMFLAQKFSTLFSHNCGV